MSDRVVYRKINVFDQFIQIFEIIISVFILEVTAHSDSEMIGSILSRLKSKLTTNNFIPICVEDYANFVFNIFEELMHNMWNIIIIQCRAVLQYKLEDLQRKCR
jgi:hypothetical protein